MDNNNNGMSAGQDTSEWRNQYPRDYRLGNIHFIKSELTNQLLFAGQAEMQNIENIAKSYEESAYAAASSKSDYIGRIRQYLERHSRNLMTSSAQSNASHTAQNSPDQVNSLDSTARTSNVNGEDWQEVYQKIRSMRDMCLMDLKDLLVKVTNCMIKHESRPQQPGNEQLKKLQHYKNRLEHFVQILQMNNTDIQRWYKNRDNLLALEAEIKEIIVSSRKRKIPQPQIVSVQHELPQTQNSQMASWDNQMNSQMQPANLHIQLDGAHSNASTAVSSKSNVVEHPLPLERLKNSVAATLTAAVGDISSLVSIVDGMAGSAPGDGCGATVGEDLVAITKCCRQARTFFTLNGTSRTKRARHSTIVTPFDGISSFSSLHDRLNRLNGTDGFELESTAASSFKRPWNKPNHALIEEIAEINRRLIDTVVEIIDEDVVQIAVASAADGGEGIIVKCSYKAVALSPTLKYKLTSAQMCPIQPLILLIPTDYPNSSPIHLDNSPADVSEEYDYLSTEVKSKFNIFLRNLPQPVSLSEVARSWDICARAVVSEFAQQRGGGTFSTKYGCDISFFALCSMSLFCT